eukprot:scaffold75_cov113-Skeletonema_dohrnii-CCMP3373.AAC.3
MVRMDNYMITSQEKILLITEGCVGRCHLVGVIIVPEPDMIPSENNHLTENANNFVVLKVPRKGSVIYKRIA